MQVLPSFKNNAIWLFRIYSLDDHFDVTLSCDVTWFIKKFKTQTQNRSVEEI